MVRHLFTNLPHLLTQCWNSLKSLNNAGRHLLLSFIIERFYLINQVCHEVRKMSVLSRLIHLYEVVLGSLMCPGCTTCRCGQTKNLSSDDSLYISTAAWL